MTKTTKPARTWLTRGEAAERAGVSERTVDRWLSRGLLTRRRSGVRPRAVRIDAAELDSALEPVPDRGTE